MFLAVHLYVPSSPISKGEMVRLEKVVLPIMLRVMLILLVSVGRS